MILALGDKKTLRSDDNGGTWYIYTSGFNGMTTTDCDIPEPHKRLIGSMKTENDGSGDSYFNNRVGGIIYSDDNGDTWNKSNIQIGSINSNTSSDTSSNTSSNGLFNNSKINEDDTRWKNFLTTKKGNETRIYSISMDGCGVIVSLDNGITWEETSVSNGDWNQIAEYKGGVVVTGDNGAVFICRPNDTDLEFEDGTVLTSAKSKIVNGKLFSYSSFSLSNGKLTLDQIDKLVTHILNTVVYPYLSLKFTGYLSFPIGDIEVKNKYNQEKINVINSSNNIYKMYRFNSIINWEEDVGMSKIGDITLLDVLDDDDDEEYIHDVIEGNTDQNYLKAIAKAKDIVDQIKTKIMLNVTNKIEGFTPKSLQDVIDKSEDEYLDNNIKAFSFYVDTAKKTAETMNQTIINNIYTFDEYMYRQLIRNAIYEMAKELSGKIKWGIIKAIENGDKTFDVFNIGLNVNFEKSLIKSVKKYAEDFKHKTKIVMDDNDKTLIDTAASYYNMIERPVLLPNAQDILVKLIDNFNIDSVVDNYNFCIKNINKFIDDIRFAQPTENKTIKEVRMEIFENYNFYYKDYDFSNVFQFIFIKLYKEFSKQLKENLEFSYMSKDFYYERITSLENSQKIRVSQYIDEIHRKFIERCLELLMDCYMHNETISQIIQSERISDNETYSIYKWISDLGDSTESKFFNEENLPLLQKEVEKFSNKILDKLLKDFTSRKEII